MKNLLPLLCTALVLPYALPSQVQAKEGTVKGHWLTQNERSVIHISECEDSVCGKIFWIIEGGMQTDAKNPDASLRTRPLCGLQILSGFEKASADNWSDGKIYKADDGDTYSANLTLQDDGTLKVRGYVGFSFLGKTQIWNRVNASKYKPCADGNIESVPQNKVNTKIEAVKGEAQQKPQDVVEEPQSLDLND